MEAFGQQELLDLIAQIYDAAVHPELWPLFLERFSDLFRSEAATLFVHDFAAGRAEMEDDNLSFVRHVRFDPDFVRSLERYYAGVNVWAKREDLLREGEVVCTRMLVPDEVLRGTEFYNDWLKPQGYFYGIGSVVARRGALGVTLTALRSAERGGYTEAELGFCRQLIPHLQRACAIHLKFTTLEVERTLHCEILDRLAIGVVLLDGHGKACFANRLAQAMAREGDGFSIDGGGYCRAVSHAETARLRHLIAGAAQTGIGLGTTAGGAMRLPRRHSERPLVVMVLPVRGALLNVDGVCALLFISDPDAIAEVPEKLLVRLYALTPAEARLAAALMGGEGPTEYAERAGLSRHTVRTHLNRVLAKTGTRRQSELMKLLWTGPAMMDQKFKPEARRHVDGR